MKEYLVLMSLLGLLKELHTILFSSLKSSTNPMCGMRDVLQNAKFQDQVLAKIQELEKVMLNGPEVMGNWMQLFRLIQKIKCNGTEKKGRRSHWNKFKKSF